MGDRDNVKGIQEGKLLSNFLYENVFNKTFQDYKMNSPQ